jgi:CDP-6-deoxy-D-xylo-4-hexulose-3-dehydrase
MKNYSLAIDTISKKELYNLTKWILKGNKLTKGELTLEFESKFSKYIGSKYSVFVNSGSSANLLILYSLLQSGRLKNKTAIVPSVSWVTTASPFMQFNFDIKLCECDKKNLGLDINHFEYLCKKNRPSVAILVNVLGHPNDHYNIKKICKKYKVELVEDSCEALGTINNKKKIGVDSVASSFSFYYGHHISTIEGGMVVTNDFKLYNLMLSIRSHGWSRDIDINIKNNLKEKYKIDDFRDLYTFYYPGYNMRSSDLNAFLGLQQLKKLDKICNIREKNFNIYKKNLDNFWCQKSSANFISSFAYGTIVQNRLEVYKYLKKFHIESRPLICGNIGRHPFWTDVYGIKNLKNADIIHDYGLYLPNNYNLNERDIIYICERFKEVAVPKFF